MNRNRVSRVFSLLLAAVFFISSNGLVLATHTCKQDSHKRVSLFTGGGCCTSDEDCGKPRATDGVMQACCVTEYNLHKTQAETTMPVQHATAASWHLPVGTALPLSPLPLLSLSSGSTDGARAPDPRTGKIFLYTIHRLLV